MVKDTGETDIKIQCDTTANTPFSASSVQKNTIMPINVMYLGMGIDIVGPMQLVPDFDTIYTINYVDPSPGYGGTINEIIEIIRIILETGHNIYSKPEYRERFRLQIPEREIKKPEILTPSKLIKQVIYDDNNKIIQSADIDIDPETNYRVKWVLEFEYNNKIRTLVYYFNHDFTFTWPDDIKNIGHILTQGSYCFSYLCDRYRHLRTIDDWYHSKNPSYECNPLYKHIIPDTRLINMIETRTCMPLTIYGLTVFHELFPHKVLIDYCYPLEDDGNMISFITFDKLEPDWWTKSYNDDEKS